MKKNKSIVWYWLYQGICISAIFILSGCSVEKENEKEILEEFFQEAEVFFVEDPESENMAGLLQEKSAGLAVRIETDKRSGSGIIWSIDKEQIVILTAGHVIGDWQSLQITFLDGSQLSYAKKEIEVVISPSSDLAILQVPTAQLQKNCLDQCRYAAIDKDTFDELKAEDIVMVLGSLDGVAANAYAGRLEEAWVYVEDFGQYMMLARVYAASGMSGGGVFDVQGHFIGVICGGNEDGELAILPLSIILAEIGEG